MPQLETPEQLCHRFAREIRARLRHFGRTHLRYSENLDGLKITVGANRTKETVDESPDLPFELRLARPSTREVYRVLVELRSELGEGACIMPKEIMERQAARDPEGDEPSRDTVNHALRELHDRQLAWSHPERGWSLGQDRHQLPGLESDRVPVFAGHSDSASQRRNVAYASGVAHDSRARLGGWAMKQYIWVPAEKVDGICFVTDARNDRVFPVNEHIKEITYETKLGRVKTVPAVRGELVGTEGKMASVKIQGGHEISVMILGDWHLAGDRSAPVEVANA